MARIVIKFKRPPKRGGLGASTTIYKLRTIFRTRGLNARAHAEGIARAFGLVRVQPPLKAISNGKPVRLLSGTFPSRESAELVAKQIRDQFKITMYIVDDK